MIINLTDRTRTCGREEPAKSLMSYTHIKTSKITLQFQQKKSVRDITS